MAFLKDSEYQRRKATNFIVIHCSATKPSQDIGVKEIREWHINERKWKDIGYHYVIRRNGVVEMGRPTWAIGSHVEEHNWESVGICLVGGLDESGKALFDFTPAQIDALANAVRFLKRDSYRTAQVVGHRDIQVTTQKDCPCFDVKAWWAPFDMAVQKEIDSARVSR